MEYGDFLEAFNRLDGEWTIHRNPLLNETYDEFVTIKDSYTCFVFRLCHTASDESGVWVRQDGMTVHAKYPDIYGLVVEDSHIGMTVFGKTYEVVL